MSAKLPFLPDQIQLLSVDALTLDPKNSRLHSAEQIGQLKKSLTEFGFTNPILINAENRVIAGHGRLAAARELGLKEVPTVRLDHLTEEQQRAYVIADNKLALNASWDESLLASELTALQEFDFDFDMLGFSEAELVALAVTVDEVDLPDLPSGEKSSLEQITFTLHSEQAEQVKEAIKLVQTTQELPTDLNQNKNGNALSFIVAEWLASSNG